LFEGRAIGQEKAYEIWEEVGFMEGMALFWQTVAAKQAAGGQALGSKKVTSRYEDVLFGSPRSDADILHHVVIFRAHTHIQTLLGLISTFPTDNPTPAPEDDTLNAKPDTADSDTMKPNEEPDLAVLLERIRARYKLLCSSLGVRPRLVVASNPEETASNGAIESSGIETATVRGAEGSGVARGMIEGVDTRLLRF
jgi:hypothetical protein